MTPNSVDHPIRDHHHTRLPEPACVNQHRSAEQICPPTTPVCHCGGADDATGRSFGTVQVAPVETVFVDVGGTLWPNAWPLTQAVRERRARALDVALGVPDAGSSVFAAIVDASTKASADEPVETVIGRVLASHNFGDDTALVRRVRQALCVNIGEVVSPFPHAGDLLHGIKQLGCRCIILSNTTLRDAEVYARDFRTLGWSCWIDGCITSIDIGAAKPHEQIFTVALHAAKSNADRCVMIGDSERCDIVPARRLGMRTMLVAIEEPPPSMTRADYSATNLREVLDVLRDWTARPTG